MGQRIAPALSSTPCATLPEPAGDEGHRRTSSKLNLLHSTLFAEQLLFEVN
jgi:hypothetical protein